MKGLTLAGLLCLALVLPALAADIELANGQDDWQMQLLGSDDSGTRIQLKLNRFQADGLIIDGAPWTALSLEDLPLHQQRGLPALPALRRSIAIADDAAMRVSVVESHFRDFSGMDIAPSKGTISRSMDPEMVSYEFSRFYESDAWFPAEIAKLGDPYIMRDVRGLVVELNPFQYNPATGTLRVYTEIVVEIESDGESFVNRLESRPDALDAEFAKIYSNHFVNYDQLNDRYVSVPEVGAMLVITYDAFHSAMLPYVDWKNQMGIPTDIVDVSSVGSTGAQIKSYIQNYYDSNGMTFVLLVGDAGEIPLPDGGSDPMYSLVAGDDSYPDIFVGRFSAENTAQVATQVERSIEYERDVALGESWMQYGMGVASNQGPGDDGEYDDDHEDVIRGKLLSYGYLGVDQIYDPTGTSAQVASGLNAGRGIVNYTGHGSTTSWSSTGFSNTSVNALVNNDMLPFICSVACNNGTFTGGTCFGEAWMKVGSVGDPRGAIGFIGTGEHWSHSRWNDRMAIGIFESFCHVGERELGRLLAATKVGLMKQFPTEIEMRDEHGVFDDESVEYYAHIYNLLGDPSLAIWTAEPDSLDISAPAAISIGANMIAVTVARKSSGDPVADARVALSAEGAPIGYALTGGDGVAHVPIVGDSETEITLTVTGTNLYPWSETIAVAASEAHLAFVSATIAGREALLPGVAASLDIEILNTGTTDLIGATGTISAPSGVTITTGTTTFGNIAQNASATSSTALLLTADAETDNGTLLRFELTTYASETEISTSEFWLTASAPEFTCVAIAGATDDIFAPGEEADLFLTLQNDGIAAGDLTATLSSLLPDSVAVVSANSTYDEIAPDATGPNGAAFAIRIADHAPIGTIVPMQLVVTSAQGPVDRVSFNLVIGEVDFSAPTGPDAYGYYALDSADIDYRAQAPVYDWIECSPRYGGTGVHLDAIRDNYAHQVVTLPFAFQYYGVVYNSIDVCDNGWIAFDTEYWYDIRNWDLPGKWGGHSQVAAFWDNLVPLPDDEVLMSEGVDGVYTFYDEERGAFVIEWSHLINWDVSTDDYQTFEILLMDPAHHPTETGDGEIIFQYKQIVNDDVGTMYATVGIEDHTEEDGILYTYANAYADGAAPLSPGLAIKFTTEKPYYEAIELDAFEAYWALGRALGAGDARSDEGLLVRWELTDERPLTGLTLTRAAQNGDGSWGAPDALHDGRLPAATGSFLDGRAEAGTTYRFQMTGSDRYGKDRVLGEFLFTGEAAGPAMLKLANGSFAASEATILYSAGAATLKALAIYDLAGRRVCDLTAAATGQMGPSSVAWNGRDERGQRVSRGVYWVRLSTTVEERTARLVMIR